MKTKKQIIDRAKTVINIERNAINGLLNFINDDFVNSISLISESNGRVILTGIGKSANIAQKIVATLNSTGTPSIFMHAADAIHGDLGIIQQNDTVICISKSGNTPEIKVLIPLIKRLGNKIISIVGNDSSYLFENSDYSLLTKVDKEACPNNLAPTSSTTAQLVMGDALAVCLLENRGFTNEDFAKYHPGGALGKKLYTRVKDLANTNNPPSVLADASIKDVIIEISSKRLGATAVIDKDRKILGIITDGDLRRMMEKFSSFENISAQDIMGESPKHIDFNEMAASAFNIMESHNITQLIVSKDNTYYGIIHLHEIIKEGII